MDNVNRNMNRMLSYIEAKKTFFDRIVAVLLALIPVLQHYNGVIDNAATTVLLVMAPYLALRFLSVFNMTELARISVVAGLLVYFVYKLIDHGTYFQEIGQVVLMVAYLVAVAYECIDTKYLTRAAICIASMAGCCLLLQYIAYYFFGFHLQLVPTDLMLPESGAWVKGVQTGLFDINGNPNRFYRPAAFFMEPSHVFMYSFPVLFICLFSTDKSVKPRIAAIIITFAMVLSTSGMGIVVAAGAWVLYFVLRCSEDGTFRLGNILRKQNLYAICIMMAVFIALVVFVPVVQESILRIFCSVNGSSTAISGRTARAINQLNKMLTVQWLIGVADTKAGLDFNLPGFMATIYKYGIIGVLLSYSFYVKSLFKLDVAYFWISAIIILVSFFSAHTHGTFFMLYYILLLMEGHRVAKGSWLKENWLPICNYLKTPRAK